MAHLIQVFQGRSVLFNDHLLVAVALLISERLGRSGCGPLLRALIERWRRGIERYAPGSIDLDLECLEGELEELEALVNAARSLRKELETSPGSVAGDMLNRLVPGERVRFRDYDKSLLASGVDDLTALLSMGPRSNE